MWNRRLMLVAIGAGLALAALIVLMMLFAATEPDGVPTPDTAPSVGAGDVRPVE